MGYIWITAKEGIRYREHPERKHGVGYDRYYTIRYRKPDGKRVEEMLGWASKTGMTVKKASAEMARLIANHTTGTGPATLSEARDLKAQADKEASRNKKIEAVKNMTFADVFEKYLEESMQVKKNPRSWKREEQLARLHIFPVVGSLPLSKIANVPHLRTLQKNMESKGLSPASIRYALHVVRIVFHFAMDEGYFTGINPALERSKRAISKNRTGIEYPQEDNKKERWLSREESSLLMQKLSKRSGEVHDMAMLALYAGMRFGEIAKLTWGNVDLFKGEMRLRQTKNGKDRTAFMTPDIQAMFVRRGPGEPGKLVFPARGTDNKPHYMISHIYYDTVKKLFNAGILDKKQWVNFHTLRHTFASWLVKDGTDIYQVKELLGHGDLKMTERYAHNKQDELKQAVRKLQNG